MDKDLTIFYTFIDWIIILISEWSPDLANMREQWICDTMTNIGQKTWSPNRLGAEAAILRATCHLGAYCSSCLNTGRQLRLWKPVILQSNNVCVNDYFFLRHSRCVVQHVYVTAWRSFLQEMKILMEKTILLEDQYRTLPGGLYPAHYPQQTFCSETTKLPCWLRW